MHYIVHKAYAALLKLADVSSAYWALLHHLVVSEIGYNRMRRSPKLEF